MLGNITNEYIGSMCSVYRRYELCMTQEQVASDIGVSRESISKFERGVRPSGLIFFWYIQKGIFTWKEIDTWQGW